MPRYVKYIHSYQVVVDAIKNIFKYGNLDIGIEFKPGDIRFPDTDHPVDMIAYYGHVRGYVGNDGDSLDCYIHKDQNLDNTLIFRIKQVDPKTGEFDEYKYMLCFASIDDAKASYLEHMPEVYFDSIKEVALDDIEESKKDTALKVTDSQAFKKIVDYINKKYNQEITDGVVSDVFFLDPNEENENDRAYDIKNSRKMLEELQAEIDKGYVSEIYNEHQGGLYNEKDELAGYERGELLGWLISASLDDSNKGIGKVLWNESEPLGAKLAKKAKDEKLQKEIHFSIKARKDRCQSINGKYVCYFKKIFGIDVVKKPALPTSTVLRTQEINDSISTTQTDDALASCEQSCECNECSNAFNIIIINIGKEDKKMSFNAERVKQLHQTDPPIDWLQCKSILQNEGSWEWKSPSDWEAIEAYWLSLDIEKSSSATPGTPAPATDGAGIVPTPVAAGEKEKDLDGTSPDKTTDNQTEYSMTEIPDETLSQCMANGMDEAATKALLETLPGVTPEMVTAALERYKQMATDAAAKKEEIPKEEVPIDKDKEKEKEKVTDISVKQKITDNVSTSNIIKEKEKKETQPVVNNTTPKTPVIDPARVDREKLLDELVAEKQSARALQIFTDSVNKKIDDADLDDTHKKDLKSLAQSKFSNNPKTAEAVMDYAIEDRIEKHSKQKVLDAKRKAMGYEAGSLSDKGASVTTQILTDEQEAKEGNFFAKCNDIAEQMIMDGMIDVPDKSMAVRQRKDNRKAFLASSFYRQLKQNFMRLGQNREKFTDAITNADIHGVDTVLNRDTVLSWMIIEESFFQTTIMNQICMALAPGSIQQRFFVGGDGIGGFSRGALVGGANKASPIDLGGVFVMGLERVKESEAAINRNYHIDRNAGRIWNVNTQLSSNIFATHSRMAGIVMDLENAQKMVSGPFKYGIAVRAALQAGYALGRSIDTELGQEIVVTTREVGAVEVTVAETPAGDGSTTGEWLFDGAGSAGGYGTNVKGVMSLLGPHATTTLKTSVENGDYYPAPLVTPRVKSYTNGLTGATTDYTPFAVTLTLPGAVTPVEGFFDRDPDSATFNGVGSYPGTTATHAYDEINARILFVGGGGMAAGSKPTAKYWYSTNYVIWSKTQGLWNADTATFDSAIVAGTSLNKRARLYMDEVATIAGDVAQDKQKYPNYHLAPFDFSNSYIGRSEIFEKRMSPTDAELYRGYGPSQIVGEDSSIIYAKTSNPRWSRSHLAIDNMGQAFSTIIGQDNSTFYGLGYVYPDSNMDRVRYAPDGGGLTEATNAMSQEMGFIDVVGTPIYDDGLNFSQIEVIIVT